tara:strand:- start:313 stop:549 length:237 start_codon:yes stop_codon:yes gene_type:complete
MNALHNAILRLEQIDGIEYYVVYDRDKQSPLGRIEVDCNIGLIKDEEQLTPMERAVYDIQAVEHEIHNNPDDGSWKNR